jgi:hypothetical protein
MVKSSKPKVPAFNTRDLDAYIRKEMERTKKTKEQILEETFHDGFVVFSETEGTVKVEGAQLFQASQPKDDTSECRRLREKFGPISDAVDYIKDMVLASGIDVFVKNPKDEKQKKLKDELVSWMGTVYQDAYKRTLKEILNVLVDDSLTSGFSAAEIVYGREKSVTFEEFAIPVTAPVMTKEGEKLVKQDVITYQMKEPVWSELSGIARLKICNNATQRLTLYRTPAWEANYWSLDETSLITNQTTPEQEIIAKSMGKYAKGQEAKKAAAYFHPWQIFALSLNGRSWDVKGTSVVLPALQIAQLLEKILDSVGEGIKRAGNKKFFIVCGTEKRPWSAVHIRNLLSQLKEASEKNWSTIPVPSGFDIKEAGGEVFEAQNVIDYFLRMIAGTMHVPPNVLGLEYRETPTVIPHHTYIRMREALKTAIETQLFRLHLWTKFGQSRVKQGGSADPQYIPEARIRSEGLFNDSDRLKMDVQVLNVGNPVRPEVKLEVERDISRIMGWDVFLPTQDEFKAEMDKLDKEMKAKLAESKPKEGDGVPPEIAKSQGPASPQTEERQQKRLTGGLNIRKTGGQKGVAKELGSTRVPAEEKAVQESVPESEQPHKLEITVKTEPQKLIVETKTPLDEHMKILADAQTKLADQQRLLAETQEKTRTDESAKEIEKIQKKIARTETEIKAREEEVKKFQTETEEIKKTGEEKRKLIKRINKDVEHEEREMEKTE